MNILTYLITFRRPLDAGIESYIVESAAFDRASHSGLLFKFKSIGVGGSVLSICREFFCNRRQKVLVDGATSEWNPIVSIVPQSSVFVPLLYILHESETFDLVGKYHIHTLDYIHSL